MRKNDVIYYNLYQALSEKACSVCQCIDQATNSFLDNLLYEFVNDYRTRDRLRETGGFCYDHSWALQRMGDPLGQSIIYADLIDYILPRIEKGEVEKKKTLIGKTHKCLVCIQEHDTKKRYIRGLLASLNDMDFRDKYRSSVGLCLPHYEMAFQQVTDGDVRAVLREVEIDSLTKLIAELKEFIRKSDYRYAGEPPGEERDAWIRAIELWVGSFNTKKQQRTILKPKVT